MSAACTFGTTGGQVYASADAGESWKPIVRDLPAVLSVEVQTLAHEGWMRSCRRLSEAGREPLLIIGAIAGGIGKFLVGFDVDFDGDVGGGEIAEFVEVVARAHAVFGTAGSCGGVEGHALRIAGFNVSERAVEVEGERYGFGDAVKGERAVHDPGGGGDSADAAAAVGHGGELLYVKVDGAAQVFVALGVLGADAGYVNGDVDAAVG
jgi:hypothetical protein